MIEQATQIIGFGPDALWVALGVAIGGGIIAKLIMDLIIKSRELRNPKVHNEKTIQDKLARDNDRLNKLEDTTAKQDVELKLILRAQVDIIHHLIDGNGQANLKQTQRDIEYYLINGRERKREA